MLKNYADSGSAAFFKHGFTATSLRFIGPGLRPPRLHVFTKNLKNIDRIYSEQIGGWIKILATIIVAPGVWLIS